MKYFFVKIFWFFINPLQKLCWFIFRPNTKGVKCLVEGGGKFLFVKLNYAHRGWTNPGGGVKRGESFLDAAIREVREETGISVENSVFIGSYESQKEYKKDIVEVYWSNSDNIEIKIDPIEIEEARWFSRNEIPMNHSGSVEKVFKLYDEFRSKTN